MAQLELRGKAQTVLGLIAPEELGITLPHEHLFIASENANFVEPETASDRYFAHQPVTIDILSWLRFHITNNIDNMNMTSEKEAIDEATYFKQAGGSTIVDVTNIGIGRDPRALARISHATGLNIIMGSGHYLATCHPKDMSGKSPEEIADEIVQDIYQGVDGTNIKAGIIGEIGISWPMHPQEKKALEGAILAQKRTGAPLTIHPGRINDKSALEILEVLQEDGANLTRAIICHIDNRVRTHESRVKIAKAGCYLEYDVFGWEGYAPRSLYKGSGLHLPNDSGRIDEIMWLIEEGFLNQIMISHDICFKSWRVKYGGIGYAHILNNVLPLMLDKGMTQQEIDTIVIENPKRILSFI